MTVPAVGAGGDPFADYRAEALQPKERALKQEMDKDLFLSLLVASVKYQDPSEPMKTQEMVQQTTALSQMEQFLEMTKVTQAQYQLSQRTAAASLVGAEISYVSDGVQATGVVQAVRLEGSDIRVDIGGQEIKLEDVVRVGVPGQQSAIAPAQPPAPAVSAPVVSAPTQPPAPAASAPNQPSAPATPAPAQPPVPVVPASSTPSTDSASEASSDASTTGPEPTAA